MKWLIFIGQKLFEDDIFIYQMLNFGQLLADSKLLLVGQPLVDSKLLVITKHLVDSNLFPDGKCLVSIQIVHILHI